MDYLSDLPLEILVNISKYLSTTDILNLASSSKRLSDIRFGIKFKHRVNFSRISTLTHFDSFINVVYDSEINLRLPVSLRVLKWHCDKALPLLPDSLTHLEISNYHDYPITSLPCALKYLRLGYAHGHSLPQLPNSLIHLDLGGCYNHPLPQLPENLEYLNLGGVYDRPLPPLPLALKNLDLGHTFHQPITEFPVSLTYLKLNYHYYSYKELPVFPISLRHLVVVSGFKLFDESDIIIAYLNWKF